MNIIQWLPAMMNEAGGSKKNSIYKTVLILLMAGLTVFLAGCAAGDIYKARDHLQEAIVAHKAGKWVEAEKQFTEAIDELHLVIRENKSKWLFCKLFNAQCPSSSNHYDSVMADLKARQARAQALRADTYLQRNDLGSAKSDAEEAIELNNDSHAHFVLAQVYHKEGDTAGLRTQIDILKKKKANVYVNVLMKLLPSR